MKIIILNLLNNCISKTYTRNPGSFETTNLAPVSESIHIFRSHCECLTSLLDLDQAAACHHTSFNPPHLGKGHSHRNGRKEKQNSSKTMHENSEEKFLVVLCLWTICPVFWMIT